MAKIKIAGYPELKDISNEEAKKAQEIKMDDSIPNSTSVQIGNMALSKGDIKMVIVDQENNSDPYREQMEDFLEGQKQLKKMKPGKRAEVSSWGHFSTWFYTFFGRKPDPKNKKMVIEKATEFYEKNPKWTLPSIMCWLEMIPRAKNKTPLRMGFDLLESAERAQIQYNGDSHYDYNVKVAKNAK